MSVLAGVVLAGLVLHVIVVAARGVGALVESLGGWRLDRAEAQWRDLVERAQQVEA